MGTRSPWLLFASLLVTGCGIAAERYQQADIRILEGQLCFFVGDSPEARELSPVLSSVRLHERVSGTAVSIWEADYLGREQSPELSPENCIPYSGGSPDPVPPLLSGKAYSVTILADVKPRDRFTARWYNGYFCMVETSQGLVPHQVDAGGRHDASGWSACGTGVGW